MKVGTMPKEKTVAAPDGRRLRSERSRQAIIDALLALMDEGTLVPTAQQVSIRAGVGIRTVFRHFSDMESLYREIILDIHDQVDPLRVEYDAEIPWRRQFDLLVLRRTGIFEKLMPLLVSSQALRYRSAAIAADVKQNVKRMRKTLRQVLPDYLVSDPVTFAAIEVMLSSEVWVRLRRDQGLSARRALAVIENAIAPMLKDSGR